MADLMVTFLADTAQERADKTDICYYRKKFRKLKVKFDEAMRQSNEYFVNEQRGIETAKRIALENEFAIPPSSSANTN